MTTRSVAARTLRTILGPGDRRGFTLVELAVVAAIISILTALAMPNFKRALVKAKAVDAVADLEVLRVAVISYLADNNQWPPDASVGAMPTGLAPYSSRRLQLRQGELHPQLRQLDHAQSLLHRRHRGDELGSRIWRGRRGRPRPERLDERVFQVHLGHRMA